MKSKRFELADNLWFSSVTGDYNPIHTDEIAARRLVFGQPVVHGVHVLFFAVSGMLEAKPGAWHLDKVRCDFKHPVGLGENIELEFGPGRLEGEERIKVLSRGGTSAVVDIVLSRLGEFPDAGIDVPKPAWKTPAHLRDEEMTNCSGSLPLALDRYELARRYAVLSERIPLIQLAVLASSTRLVGMYCPGLNSVYSGLDLVFDPQVDSNDHFLKYEVKKFDRRINRLIIAASGGGATGTISAFVRPSQFEQISLAKLMPLVRPEEFMGQRALIIGGSRGLGEVCAKILSLGGAETVLTYYRGRKDAEALAGEINAYGHKAGIIHWNVLDPSTRPFVELENDFSPTHLYYFATPAIFRGRKELFSRVLFDEFVDYYISGFERTVNSVKELSTDLRAVFYPSSVAVEDTPLNMTEYAAAKAAGEKLCGFLSRRLSLRILVERLPRLTTDQTRSLIPVPDNDPTAFMLKVARQLQQP